MEGNGTDSGYEKGGCVGYVGIILAIDGLKLIIDSQHCPLHTM